MNKKAFFDEVRSMRTSIVYGSDESYLHKELDNIVKIVIGDEKMKPENLEEAAMELIRKIKKLKEDDKLKKQAGEIIEKIKAELE